ncbi:hypothetical protein [Ensifer aridi]|uniref:hypothetical protein n=1 Tax=Ensifer aridi TaxID=1708715 RepID=UPI0004145745|nr:hypothetical protein [Ensifer aridi]
MIPEIQRARQRIEAKIQELIEILDLLDGDADLEPALGWPLLGPRVLVEAAYFDDDREHEDEREDDPAERGIADLDGREEQGLNYSFAQTVRPALKGVQ